MLPSAFRQCSCSQTHAPLAISPTINFICIRLGLSVETRADRGSPDALEVPGVQHPDPSATHGGRRRRAASGRHLPLHRLPLELVLDPDSHQMITAPLPGDMADDGPHTTQQNP